MSLVWRPSMFLPQVVHLAREGDAAVTSEHYPGERWVRSACGQRTIPEGVESLDSLRCPECVLWLEGRRGVGRDEPHV